MTIRLKVLFACIAFATIIAFVGVMSHVLLGKISAVALGMYDEAFTGVTYTHKAQAKFLRLDASHYGKDIIVAQPDREQLGRIEDDLDIAIERALSDKGRTLAKQIHADISGMKAQPLGSVISASQIAEADGKMNRLVSRYSVDGFDYRTHSSELVSLSDKYLRIMLGVALSLTAITALVLLRAIIPQINKAVNIAKSIELGRLDNVIVAEGNSETAVLLRTLASMQVSIAGNIRRIAEETRRAERERIANQTKSEFLTNMSHELRTPMHSILGFSRQASKRIAPLNDEKLSAFIGNIQISGNRLLSLLDALLDLAKLEAGRIDFKYQKESIRRPINQTMLELESQLNAKRIRVVIREENEPKPVEYDYKSLIQVFINLISNAIKFSPPDTEISITLSESTLDEKPALLCSIRDWGVGIPENEIETVFDKFVQSSKTKSGAGGTGLGLAITREIIRAHNGRIWAENCTPTGSCFYLLLPYEFASQAARAAS